LLIKKETKVQTKIFSMCLLAGVLVSGCGGGDDVTVTPSPSGPRLLSSTLITGVGVGTNFGFDLGLVVGSRYYFTDRNNAAVDVFDTANSSLLAQVKNAAFPFAGAQAGGNSVSGPDGINLITKASGGNRIYVGDVNSIKVVDPATNVVEKAVVVGASGKRADEGCFDADDNLYMISTPEADTPFATFINTTNDTVVAQVTFTDNKGHPSLGLEQCRYDTVTKKFYVNNDGTTDNPNGELVAIPATSIKSLLVAGTVTTANYVASPASPAGEAVVVTAQSGLSGTIGQYPEGNCDPTGLALGPNNDIAVGCREGTAGAPLLVQIMDRTNGAILKSINAGGGDEIEYDAGTNRYYNAGSRWTKSGLSSGASCSAASPCTPVLSIIDAASRTLVTQIASGNNAHSVAIDSATGKAFMPASSGASPAGCASCGAEAASLLTFAIR
jgi:hypothetical protein